MNTAPAEHQKLLQAHRSTAGRGARRSQTRDEIAAAARRAEHAGDARHGARPREQPPRSAAAILVLEFHDPLLPSLVTATGGVIATAVCLFAVALGFAGAPTVVIGSRR